MNQTLEPILVLMRQALQSMQDQSELAKSSSTGEGYKRWAGRFLSTQRELICYHRALVAMGGTVPPLLQKSIQKCVADMPTGP